MRLGLTGANRTIVSRASHAPAHKFCFRPHRVTPRLSPLPSSSAAWFRRPFRCHNARAALKASLESDVGHRTWDCHDPGGVLLTPVLATCPTRRLIPSAGLSPCCLHRYDHLGGPRDMDGQRVGNLEDVQPGRHVNTRDAPDWFSSLSCPSRKRTTGFRPHLAGLLQSHQRNAARKPGPASNVADLAALARWNGTGGKDGSGSKTDSILR